MDGSLEGIELNLYQMDEFSCSRCNFFDDIS